ncbi:hypothetical protein SCLCIDRAFT_1224756 [Scleroderma citrinum Foug A]|uniref:Uncharacterized protein n=1 Tax=Scleroderma citrinum Foug A TaxID=1036808 RepID=A0A0C3D450_9AGAM|nr:hypothetical protein SCLCIDRAFT_1224756 [Scleroderma citrinum Foug A]
MLSRLSRAHPQSYPSLLSQDRTDSTVIWHYPHRTSAQHAWTHQYYSSLLPHSLSAPGHRLGVQPLGNNSQSPAPYLECPHTYILP